MRPSASSVGVPMLLILLVTLFVAGKASHSDLPCDPPCVNGECTPYLGNLTCECYGNWSGEDCSTFICEIENLCLNNGTCSYDPTDVSLFTCACPIPYFGSICQFTAEASQNSSCDAVPDPCNGSPCYNLASGGHQCFCEDDRWGIGCNYSYSNPVPADKEDRCLIPNYCHGNGQCVWDERFDYFSSGCNCNPGWSASHQCEIVVGITMLCRTNPCGGRGSCSYVFSNGSDGDVRPIDYHCTCNSSYRGRNCDVPFNVCEPNPCGDGVCNATHDGHYFQCDCREGTRGNRCEFFDNPCDDITCQNGGTCVPEFPPNPDGSYNSSKAQCVCCTGYYGDECEHDMDNHTLCQPNPCQNDGHCTLVQGLYECSCEPGFKGVNCELEDLCPEVQCHPQNTITCITTAEEGAVCVCKEEWGGQICEDDIDECLDTNPCLYGGTCVNSAGGFTCDCPPDRTGDLCQTYVPQPVNCSTSQMCLNGGTCEHKSGGTMVCNCLPGFTGNTCEKETCPYDNCTELARNGRCDEQCFNEQCGFDGGERFCLPDSNQTDPWNNCPNSTICRQNLENGVCDTECNTRECLFDSYECVPHPECPASLIAQCLSQERDGKCDEMCNTPQCPFDSEDCNSRDYINDLLVIYVLGKAGGSFKDNKTAQMEFERVVGDITNTNPVIQGIQLLSEEQGLKENIVVPEDTNLYRVTLRLDVEYCSDQCLQSIEEAVMFLNAYYSSGKDIAGFSYVKSKSESGEGPPDEGSNSTTTTIIVVVTVSVVGILGLFIVAGVLVRKRKIRARIFYPGQSQVDDSTNDRASASKRRKVAHTDPASGALVNSTEDSSIAASCSSGDYIREGAKNAKMEGSSKVTWVDFRVPVSDSPSHDPLDMAVVAQIGHDSRKWNYLHYSAVRNPEVMRSLLEKCRNEESKKWDINTPGPGGYTPLMLAVTQKNVVQCENFASRSSSSSEASTETNELSPMTKSNHQLVPRSDTSSPSGSVPSSPLNSSVDALLSARVKLDATNDYGRTSLHLAAVCARGDFVNKLLAAGANPNVQDNWGQSPLHAAIGAAAEGAFKMLINFPKTDINLKSDGGITPLMDAVKITNMYMVKQLVKKNADISLTDYEGRTAVHWAAMTENPEALKLLIRQGPDTIKDTQDNKGQTPLFLACREGATESAKHLLDVFANATLLDNLDRSPMTIAYERQHHFIMEMLKSHGPYHYQLPASARHGHHVPHHIQMVQQHHHEMAMRQQMAPQGYQTYAPPHTSHDPMMEMQQMTAQLQDQFHTQPGHPEMQLPPRGQTFGDVGYPPSSMDLGLSESTSYKHINTPLFFSNTMQHAAENGGIHTPTTVQQSFYPPSTSSQLPPSTEQHHSPPTAYHHHQQVTASPPTQLQQQPTTSSDLVTMSTYNQPHPQPEPTTYPSYPASSGHFAVTTTTSDSEQLLVNELITSISNDTSSQQALSTFASANNTTLATRPLQHIDIDTTNLPVYPATSDPYAPTVTNHQQQQQLYSPPQQPHSASSVHSNRSPSSLYPSPPNSDTLQHSTDTAHQNGMTAMAYSHASPPSLTPSPEGRDETAQHTITTVPVEGLIQQHDYPSGMYGGVDSYNYGGIRFMQDYNNTETTV